MPETIHQVQRAIYSAPISSFLVASENEILGSLAAHNPGGLEHTQRDAWVAEIRILKGVLRPYAGRGKIYFEYSIPRLGRRIDVLAIIDHVIFVLEFKVGETTFASYALDQVWDYGLDLKNFHEASHERSIAPILIATNAETSPALEPPLTHKDGLFAPIKCSPSTLARAIDAVLRAVAGRAIDVHEWENGRYCPTPTIIEAAMALYGGHAVSEISRSDAGATNLRRTSKLLSEIIADAKRESKKMICFVTGVPGAGKTLVGLDIATKHIDKRSDLYSVYLSGNGPLVAILREALARDKIERERARGTRIKKGAALSQVKLFVQNVDHFRDECLVDADRPPIEHVALFDEAQRAWNREKASAFMRQKKGRPGFDQSEPEFLISCLDRHKDWAVIVCLVGGGQEINSGEAGISEWIDVLLRKFPTWHSYFSPRLTESEYSSGRALEQFAMIPRVGFKEELHLGVSMRSFRAENVSLLVKHVLDLDLEDARATFRLVADRYPIVLTRELGKAKLWLRTMARGSERYGIVVSSEAQRLKPHAIDVRTPMDPVHWFLDGKEDVRSSYYMEDVATEFHVQGLELDWSCVTWDGDFRYSPSGWAHWSFRGNRWTRIRKSQDQGYLKNAYRVLLTRARQGMVIVVPQGDADDPTRDAEFYDPTFEYLKQIGIPTL